jgi:hypothetical protein
MSLFSSYIAKARFVIHSVPFIMSLSTENLSYKNPAFTGTFRDNGFTQGHDKRDTPCLSILPALNGVLLQKSKVARYIKRNFHL